MKFEEVLSALREGKGVYRRDWTEGTVMYFDGSDVWCRYPDSRHIKEKNLEIGDFLSEDWEVVE